MGKQQQREPTIKNTIERILEPVGYQNRYSHLMTRVIEDEDEDIGSADIQERLESEYGVLVLLTRKRAIVSDDYFSDMYYSPILELFVGFTNPIGGGFYQPLKHDEIAEFNGQDGSAVECISKLQYSHRITEFWENLT